MAAVVPQLEGSRFKHVHVIPAWDSYWGNGLVSKNTVVTELISLWLQFVFNSYSIYNSIYCLQLTSSVIILVNVYMSSLIMISYFLLWAWRPHQRACAGSAGMTSVLAQSDILASWEIRLLWSTTQPSLCSYGNVWVKCMNPSIWRN